jgi:hypothetical protein
MATELWFFFDSPIMHQPPDNVSLPSHSPSLILIEETFAWRAVRPFRQGVVNIAGYGPLMPMLPLSRTFITSICRTKSPTRAGGAYHTGSASPHP